MNPTTELEPIPPRKPGVNSYRPEDIKRWGIERFMKERGPQEPFQIPPMHFTEEENRRMDELLEEERQAKTNGL